MSTTPTPTPQAPVLPFLAAATAHIQALAQNTTAAIAAAQADFKSGNKAVGVEDLAAGAALDVAQFAPAQAANVEAALSLFTTGVGLFQSIFALFHHPAAQAAAAPAAPAPPAA